MFNLNCLSALLLVLPTLVQCTTKYYRNDLEPKDYSDHKLVQIKPSSLDQIARIHALEEEFELEYWNDAMDDLRPILTLVDSQRNKFFHQLNRSSISYTIVSNNFQSIVDREQAELKQARDQSKGFDFENVYYPYEDIKQQLKVMANQSLVKAEYFLVGKTYEGREIPALKFGTGPAIFFECGIHSSEWIATSYCLYAANQLLNNPALSNYTKNHEFVVVPILNVDGYVYTHTVERIWRKTRSPTSNPKCIGVDPNRNWDIAFGQDGAVSNPCYATYAGENAFSEVETLSMSKLATKYKGKMDAYFAFHSFGQLFMHPYGYTKTLPRDNQKMEKLVKLAAAAIKNTTGSKFDVGPIISTIYITSGSSVDWVFDKIGPKAAFAIEMRDTGEFGFMLPTQQIKIAVEEIWAGVKTVIDNLNN